MQHFKKMGIGKINIQISCHAVLNPVGIEDRVMHKIWMLIYCMREKNKEFSKALGART